MLNDNNLNYTNINNEEYVRSTYKNAEYKYYCVTAKCGHVRVSNYTLHDFPNYARSKKEAAKYVREAGRVKHDHDDAIRNVVEITLEEYSKLQQEHNNDPWVMCHSIQDQRRLCPDMVIYKEERKYNKYEDIDYKHNKKDYLEKQRRSKNKVEYSEKRYYKD